MRKQLWMPGLVALLLVAAGGGPARAAGRADPPGLAPFGGITQFPIPTAGSKPTGITIGPDGNLWFTEMNANQIGRITPSGTVTEYGGLTPASAPFWIVPGPDGRLWFTESGANKIGAMTTSGGLSEYPIPTASSYPQGITLAPDGALWFTENSADRIGQITTSGVVTEYAVPTAGSRPAWIIAAPDGALWFTEFFAGQIGRITTSGIVSEYTIPTPNTAPAGITLGPAGALWFAEHGRDAAGQITMAGTVTEYPLPTAASAPIGITGGPDGALWLTESGGNALARMTTTGSVTEFPIPTAGSMPYGIAPGPDGNLWFTEQAANLIGQMIMPFVPTPTPAPSATPCAISFSDVHPTDYFYGPVRDLYCHGVISGYADGTFRPYANTTRAQMVKIVVLGFALPLTTPPGGAYSFEDVPPSQPFFPYVETAAAGSIVSGYGCGGPGEPCNPPANRAYFRPYADVTRGQLAKIDVVAAAWPLNNPPTGRFEDVLPGTAFYTFVETAASHGVISGYTCGGPGELCVPPGNRPYFRQYNNAVRGQIAKIVDLSISGP